MTEYSPKALIIGQRRASASDTPAECDARQKEFLTPSTIQKTWRLTTSLHRLTSADFVPQQTAQQEVSGTDGLRFFKSTPLTVHWWSSGLRSFCDIHFSHSLQSP
jgi:hypothetical protein